jgi:hypothetical protein
MAYVLTRGEQERVMPLEESKPVDPRHDEHLEHSVTDVLELAALGLAAGPFAQAMLTELGTGSGKAIREALNRVLRRQAPSAAPEELDPLVPAPLWTDYGWKLLLGGQEVPSPEGLAQVSRLSVSAPIDSQGQPIAAGQIIWNGRRWIGSPASEVAVFYWDDARNQWVLPPYAGGPSQSTSHE